MRIFRSLTFSPSNFLTSLLRRRRRRPPKGVRGLRGSKPMGGQRSWPEDAERDAKKREAFGYALMNASMRLGSGFVQPRSGGAHRPLRL
jgi:hypothetical protein